MYPIVRNRGVAPFLELLSQNVTFGDSFIGSDQTIFRMSMVSYDTLEFMCKTHPFLYQANILKCYRVYNSYYLIRIFNSSHSGNSIHINRVLLNGILLLDPNLLEHEKEKIINIKKNYFENNDYSLRDLGSALVEQILLSNLDISLVYSNSSNELIT